MQQKNKNKHQSHPYKHLCFAYAEVKKKCSLIFSLHGSEQHSDHKETPTDGRLHQVAMTTVTFTDA